MNVVVVQGVGEIWEQNRDYNSAKSASSPTLRTHWWPAADSLAPHIVRFASCLSSTSNPFLAILNFSPWDCHYVFRFNRRQHKNINDLVSLFCSATLPPAARPTWMARCCRHKSWLISPFFPIGLVGGRAHINNNKYVLGYGPVLLRQIASKTKRRRLNCFCTKDANWNQGRESGTRSFACLPSHLFRPRPEGRKEGNQCSRVSHDISFVEPRFASESCKTERYGSERGEPYKGSLPHIHFYLWQNYKTIYRAAKDMGDALP